MIIKIFQIILIIIFWLILLPIGIYYLIINLEYQLNPNDRQISTSNNAGILFYKK